jgi:hypothetical protein
MLVILFLIINFLSDIAASEAIVKDEIVNMWKDISTPPRNTREAGDETKEDKLTNSNRSSTKMIPIKESNNTVSETNAENQQIEIQNINEDKDKGVESSEVSSTKEDSGFDEIEPVTGVSTPLQGQIEDMQPERNMENDAEITEKKETKVKRSSVKTTESRKSRSRSPQKASAKSKDLKPKSKPEKNKNHESRKASPLKRNPSKSGTKQSASLERKTNATSEPKTEELLQELSNNKEELKTNLVTEELTQEKEISSGETALQCSENENISFEAKPEELEKHIDDAITEENSELNRNDENEEVRQHEEDNTKETLNRSKSMTKEKRTRSKSPKKVV